MLTSYDETETASRIAVKCGVSRYRVDRWFDTGTGLGPLMRDLHGDDDGWSNRLLAAPTECLNAYSRAKIAKWSESKAIAAAFRADPRRRAKKKARAS